MRHGAVRLEPNCDRVIGTTQTLKSADGDLDWPNLTLYAVTRGALRLKFGCLFLGQPDQGEGDIIVGRRNLQVYVGDIWWQQ